MYCARFEFTIEPVTVGSFLPFSLAPQCHSGGCCWLICRFDQQATKANCSSHTYRQLLPFVKLFHFLFLSFTPEDRSKCTSALTLYITLHLGPRYSSKFTLQVAPPTLPKSPVVPVETVAKAQKQDTTQKTHRVTQTLSPSLFLFLPFFVVNATVHQVVVILSFYPLVIVPVTRRDSSASFFVSGKASST